MRVFIAVLAVTLATFFTWGGRKGLPVQTAYAETPAGAERSKQITITIGSKSFIAALEDNVTAREFRTLLPMTISMMELNGNEKYFRLSDDVPVNASVPGTIQIGDLMIYGSRTVVLFYKSFPTSYEYTRLGRINDTKGLAATVGSGSVKVTLSRSNHEERVGF